MSMEQDIGNLEQLAAMDAEIKKLTGGIETERGEIDGVRTEVAELEGRLETDRESVHEMDKTRGDLVQEIRQISQQIDRSRERLQRARNEREVNAAERELDELRKIQRDRDEEVKRLGELAEQARVSIHESETRKGELSSRLEGTLPGATETIASLEDRLAQLKRDRAETIKRLPSRVARRYERLLTRGRSPIAQSHDGTCNGCFVKLPPMLFHQMLSRREFEECPTCHRIIYYAPKVEQSAEGEGDDSADAGTAADSSATADASAGASDGGATEQSTEA